MKVKEQKIKPGVIEIFQTELSSSTNPAAASLSTSYPGCESYSRGPVTPPEYTRDVRMLLHLHYVHPPW